MAGESEFKKTDLETLYDEDVNKGMYRVFTAFEQETLAVTASAGSVTYSAERDYHILKNTGTKVCYINFDSTAGTTNYKLYDGETEVFETNATIVHAICDTGEATTLKIIGQH